MGIMDVNANDSEKVVVQSPYKLYPGEELVKIPAAGGGFFDARPEDVEMLRIINRYLLMTSRLITMAMNNSGWKIDDQDVKKRLKIMGDKGIIAKYRFTSESGRSSYLVYRLDFKGKAVLIKDNAEKGRMTSYVDFVTGSKDVETVKRILAVNQCLISCFTGDCVTGESYETITGSMVTDAPAGRKARRLFRATGLAHRTGESILVEAVRRGDNSKEELIKKLNRIGDTLAHSTVTGIEKDDVMIYVLAEDKAHMEEIAALLNTLDYHDHNMVVTYDTGIFNGDDDIIIIPEARRKNLIEKIHEAFNRLRCKNAVG